jgi:hypothetical protein
MMVILNPGNRHFTFTFDEGCGIVQSGVQMLNVKSLSPKAGKISWVATYFHFWLWALPMGG